ncbi:MAG: glycerophosphodiester phosphodiesterase family protein [Spirochaetia bacterium]
MRRNRRPPLVLGHRGYRARYPENTLLAFRRALEAGADGIECDLQKTADGRYVIVHDPDTARVSGASRAVGTTQFDDLRALDFGAGEKIPELIELLEILPAGRYLDLELKEETLTVKDCASIADVLAGRIEQRNLMISSFDPRLLPPFRLRGFTVGFLVGEETARKGVGAFVLLLLRLRPQYLNLPIDIMKSKRPRAVGLLLRIFRLLGFSLLFWTVNTAGGAASVAGAARILVTDQVEELVRWRDQSILTLSRPFGGSG